MLKITKIIFQGMECKKINNLFKFAVIYLIDENGKEYKVKGRDFEDWVKEWNILGVVLQSDGSIFYLYVPDRVYNYIDNIDTAPRFEDKYVFVTDVWFNSDTVIVYLSEEYCSWDGYVFVSRSNILTLNELINAIYEADKDAFANRKRIFIQEYKGSTYEIKYTHKLASLYAKESLLRRD